MANSNLKEKVVLITGASSGIGRACAEAFAADGCFLAIGGRNAEALQETKSKCCQIGVDEKNIIMLLGDLAEDDICERLVQSVLKHFGQLNILVNNAAILKRGSVETTDMESFDSLMNTNVRSPFFLTKLCLPHLIKTKGNVVNISSISGIRPFPGGVAYSMCKAAIDQFTKCMSVEVADRGVRVNSVNPAVIVTDIHRRAGISSTDYKEYLEKCKLIHPLGRVGQDYEVAAAVRFLASDSASFITGVNLHLDGGYANACPRLK